MTLSSAEIELANLVLTMDWRTDKGQKAQRLARTILLLKDPSDELSKYFLVNELETLMPKLEDLKKDLLAMNTEELRKKILEIRADRVIRKEPATAKRKKVRTKEKSADKMVKLLEGMSPEEIATLFEGL